MSRNTLNQDLQQLLLQQAFTHLIGVQSALDAYLSLIDSPSLPEDTFKQA